MQILPVNSTTLFTLQTGVGLADFSSPGFKCPISFWQTVPVSICVQLSFILYLVPCNKKESLGFWNPCRGSRIPIAEFQIPDSNC